MRRRVIVAAGMAATIGLATPTAALSATRGEWALADRSVSYGVVSAWPGEIEGRPGNWHLVRLGTSDDAHAEGAVEDWTCPDGEVLLDPVIGANPACSMERTFWTLREGNAGVAVTWVRRAHLMVMHGRMELVDNDSGLVVGHRRVHVLARGVGRPSVFVDEGDGYREVTRTWLDTRARGRVAGHRLRDPESVTVSNPIYEVSSFLPG